MEGVTPLHKAECGMPSTAFSSFLSLDYGIRLAVSQPGQLRGFIFVFIGIFRKWLAVTIWKCQSLSRLFATPWTVACQVPLSLGFPRQEYWSGWQFPSRGDLPNPGMEPPSLTSPALAGGFFTTSTMGELLYTYTLLSILTTIPSKPWKMHSS